MNMDLLHSVISLNVMYSVWHIRKPGGKIKCLLIYIRLRTQGKRSYLCEIEDVSVGDCEQSIDCTTECIDLLVWVPYKDLPTWLRQNYIHDSCNQSEGKLSKYEGVQSVKQNVEIFT